MHVELSSALHRRLIDEATRAYPRECCGLLFGQAITRELMPYAWRIESLRPAANAHPDPERRFEIDPRILIDANRAAREGGPQVIGYYHSHPDGAPEPSPTDAAQAAHDARIWAIVGRGRVGFWIDRDAFEALPTRLVDG